MPIPKNGDNSPEAQRVRVRAVKQVACPTCGAPPGRPCVSHGTPKGMGYNPRYDVHRARLDAAAAPAP